MIAIRRKTLTSRRGLTLLELAVVLVILVALAGILVPLLPNMLGRGSASTGAANQVEIGKWIQSYEQINFAYPTDWDALVDGGSGGAMISWVRGTPDIVLDTGLAAGEATALTAAGINRLQLMNEAGVTTTGGFNRTFNPYFSTAYAGGALIPATGAKLVILTATGQRQLGLSDGTVSNGKFVVVGFGRRTSIVGKGVQNTPVVFRDDGSQSPDQVYSRYGAVFQVANTTGPMDRARFVGVCNFTATGIQTSDDDLARFNDLTRTGS